MPIAVDYYEQLDRGVILTENTGDALEQALAVGRFGRVFGGYVRCTPFATKFAAKNRRYVP